MGEISDIAIIVGEIVLGIVSLYAIKCISSGKLKHVLIKIHDKIIIKLDK